MDTVFSDLRYGLRGFVRAPGFTLTAVLALALGIGANTAIFSAIYPVLFKSLPFPDAQRLVRIIPFREGTGEDSMLSFPDFRDWREQVQSLEGLSAYSQESVALGTSQEPIRTRIIFATSNLFAVLGAKAALGRTLEDADDAPTAEPVTVLSHRLWEQAFASNPRVLGQSVQLDGRSFTIVGVLPESFRLSPTGKPPGLWAPLRTKSHPELLDKRGQHFLSVIARIKKSISVDQVGAEMRAINRRLDETLSTERRGGEGFKIIGLQERATESIRPVAMLLLAAVAVVLLIACTNVANLLLARANARQREFAIRLSQGATSGRIARQLFTESILLSALGGATGLLLTLWLSDGLKALFGNRIGSTGIDGPVILFAATIALLTGIIFGVAPVFGLSRIGIYDALKDAGNRASMSRGRVRMQDALIASQLALAFALLVGAGVMMKSLVHLTQVNPGFEVRNAVTVSLPLPEWSYSTETKRDFYERLFKRVKVLPGVVAVGGGDPFPFEDGNSRTTVSVEGLTLPSDMDLNPNMYEVSPDYFRAMGIPLIEGRTFTDAERTADENRAIIINQKFAQRFWPSKSPLGKRIRMGTGKDDPWLEIIGVVGNVRHGALETEAPLQFYVPYEFSRWMRLMMVVRTEGPAAGIIPALRKLIREADSNLPIDEPQLASAIIAETLADRRVAMILLGAFSVRALGLATFGLYGLITYAVGQRQHEFAIRMALGAQPRDVIRLVLSKGLRVLLLGLSAGVALSLAGTRLLSSLLYGVAASDLSTYALIAILLGGSALLASYFPARRATRVDPLIVLRAQ